MIVEFKELEEQLSKMWLKIEDLNERTKKHTIQIKELKKEVEINDTRT